MKPAPTVHESPRKEARGRMTEYCTWCRTVQFQGDPRLATTDVMCKACLRAYFPQFEERVLESIKRGEK
jgi:hypothetical protein